MHVYIRGKDGDTENGTSSIEARRIANRVPVFSGDHFEKNLHNGLPSIFF